MSRKNIIIVCILFLVAILISIGYVFLLRTSLTPSSANNSTYDAKLSACGAFPNNSTQQEIDTSRAFIDLPKNLFPKEIQSDFETVSGNATAGYVSNGGMPGEGLEATADCWSTYFEFDGNGEVDLDVPATATGTPDYIVHFVVVPNPQDASSTTSHALGLNSISPTSASVGTTVTLNGSGFTSDNTVLFNGQVAAKHVALSLSARGQTLTFAVPSAVGPDCKAGEMCPQYLRKLTPGTYAVSVENENGMSNTVSLTVQ